MRKIIDISPVAADGGQFQIQLVPIGISGGMVAAGDDHHFYALLPHLVQSLDGLGADLQLAVEQCPVQIQGNQAVLHVNLQGVKQPNVMRKRRIHCAFQHALRILGHRISSARRR